MHKNILFFPGLGEKPREYPSLSKYMRIADVDWNTGKFSPKISADIDTIISFSLGDIFPLEYSQKHRLKKMILCSPTPFETLGTCKAEEIVFVVGEKKIFLRENLERIMQKSNRSISLIIVPKGDHRVDTKYQKILLNLVTEKA